MSVIQTIRAWLIFFRAHTAILETPMAVLGAALGLGTIQDPIILGWLLFGVLYHFTGYGMNSYVDWKKGFDKDDPRKQHHPLNTGDITPKHAKAAMLVTLGLLISSGLILGGSTMTTLASLVVMLLSGVSYNYFGKYTDFKFLPISIVHTMVFVFPYLVYSNDVSTFFMLIAAAYFIHHSFQIMISGDVKDIDQDEASLIKRLGARIDDSSVNGMTFYPGMPVQYITYTLSVLELSLAASALVIFGELYSPVPYISVIPILVLGCWMIYETDKMITPGPFNRGSRLTHMSRKELAGYMMVHSSMLPVIGIFAYVAVIVGMVVYLFGTSKFMWGTYVRPKV